MTLSVARESLSVGKKQVSPSGLVSQLAEVRTLAHVAILSNVQNIHSVSLKCSNVHSDSLWMVTLFYCIL